jgi:hypothetical protein
VVTEVGLQILIRKQEIMFHVALSSVISAMNLERCLTCDGIDIGE